MVKTRPGLCIKEAHRSNLISLTCVHTNSTLPNDTQWNPFKIPHKVLWFVLWNWDKENKQRGRELVLQGQTISGTILSSKKNKLKKMFLIIK